MAQSLVMAAVRAGASAKQLGAVTAAAARSAGCASPASQADGAVLKRVGALSDALIVKQALDRKGLAHHNLGLAVKSARDVGALGVEETRAARRVTRKANQACHEAFNVGSANSPDCASCRSPAHDQDGEAATSSSWSSETGSLEDRVRALEVRTTALERSIASSEPDGLDLWLAADKAHEDGAELEPVRATSHSQMRALDDNCDAAGDTDPEQVHAASLEVRDAVDDVAQIEGSHLGISAQNPYLICRAGWSTTYPPADRVAMESQMGHLEC